jgi:hypothetical protein
MSRYLMFDIYVVRLAALKHVTPLVFLYPGALPFRDESSRWQDSLSVIKSGSCLPDLREARDLTNETHISASWVLFP